MNEDAVQETLTQAGIPCEITARWDIVLHDGMVKITGTPFHVQVGKDYLVVCKKTRDMVQYAEFNGIDQLVEQVRGILSAYRKLN